MTKHCLHGSEYSTHPYENNGCIQVHNLSLCKQNPQDCKFGLYVNKAPLYTVVLITQKLRLFTTKGCNYCNRLD